jgi:hypothetical protein
LRTSRTEYSQQLGRGDFVEHIRRLMKEQHRAMFTALRAGEFDEIIRTIFENGATALAGVSELPASQRPALRSNELPPLSLPSPETTSESESAPATARFIKRPSHRPSGRPSRIPLRPAAQHQQDAEQVARLARPDAKPTSASSLRLSLGRPPMDSSERYTTSRSLFGDSAGSEQSLGDVILSYVEESKEKGSGRL